MENTSNSTRKYFINQFNAGKETVTKMNKEFNYLIRLTVDHSIIDSLNDAGPTTWIEEVIKTFDNINNIIPNLSSLFIERFGDFVEYPSKNELYGMYAACVFEKLTDLYDSRFFKVLDIIKSFSIVDGLANISANCMHDLLKLSSTYVEFQINVIKHKVKHINTMSDTDFLSYESFQQELN